MKRFTTPTVLNLKNFRCSDENRQTPSIWKLEGFLTNSKREIISKIDQNYMKISNFGGSDLWQNIQEQSKCAIKSSTETTNEQLRSEKSCGHKSKRPRSFGG